MDTRGKRKPEYQPARGPEKGQETKRTRRDKWQRDRVDCFQRKLGMEHYKNPAWLKTDPVLDLQEYERHFENLSKGDLFASIVFFLSVLFSVIHAWKPDKSFKNYCPERTSPARALCFLNRLRLNDGEMKTLRRGLQPDVAYGALNAIDQMEESKKNVPADSADSLNETKKHNPNRMPMEELRPILHCAFKKMLFKFVTQQWSRVLRYDHWDGWEEFKEYFATMHNSQMIWNWKRKDLQYKAWDELLDFVQNDPCCQNLYADDLSSIELNEAQGKLTAYMSKPEEPQTQSSSWRSAPIEPPGSASNEAATEGTPPDAETSPINQAEADLFFSKEKQRVHEIQAAMTVLENADWLMSAPHDHKEDFDALIALSQRYRLLKDIQEFRQTAGLFPTSLRAYAILPVLALQKVEANGQMPMFIHNLSDRGIRKPAGECDYHDPGNVALDFSYYVLQLWKFVLPTKHSSANQYAWRSYGDPRERSGTGAMNRRGNMIEAILSNAMYFMKQQKQSDYQIRMYNTWLASLKEDDRRLAENEAGDKGGGKSGKRNPKVKARARGKEK